MNRRLAFSVVAISLLALSIFASKPVQAASENSWTAKAPMHEARASLGVAVVDEKIYAIGGDTTSGDWTITMGITGGVTGGIVSTNEEYDPSTDTWASKASMPTPRAGFGIAVFQNKIYCIGGTAANGSVTGVNEVYDPATDTWTTKTSMPATAWLRAHFVNGKIYAIGGSTNYVYDPLKDSWIEKTGMPIGAGQYASAVFENKIYVIGGASSDQHYNLNQVYDTETDAWSTGASPPISVSTGAAVATAGILAPERIYVLGESQNLNLGESRNNVRIYDPANDSWAIGADIPTRRLGLAVAIVNDTLYAIGGAYPGEYVIIGHYDPVNANEQYTPLGYGTVTPPAPTPSPSPIPTPTPTPSPSPSPTPSASTSPSPTEQPTQTPEPQPSTFPNEFIYAAAGVAVILAVAVVAVALRRKKQ